MKILGINGIRSDGSTNTDRVLDDLTHCGWPVFDVNYPRVRVITARSRRRQLRNAEHLANAHEKGDVVIAHSYGCLLTLRAMELGARFSLVFFFGAAMNRDFTFPYLGMSRLYNIHNPGDRALGLGRMLIAHDFGDMGKLGYNGPLDPRVEDVLSDRGRIGTLRHSHYFSDSNRPRWVSFIDQVLRQWHGLRPPKQPVHGD